MKKNYAAIDANIILRFLLDDVPDQTLLVDSLFERTEDDKLIIPDIVITEVVFVLLNYYKLTKIKIVQKISSFIANPIFMLNRKHIYKALEIYRDNEVSFVDSYLSAGIAKNEYKCLFTFDKKLMKINPAAIITPQPH